MSAVSGMRAYRGGARILAAGRTLEVDVDLWARDGSWGGSIPEDAGLHDGDRVRVVLPTGESGEALVSIVPTACVAYLVAVS